ncbi:nucleolin 1 [Fagus crenata]
MPAVKTPAKESSNSSSEESDDEPVTKKPAGAAKNGTLAAPAKKGVPTAKLPAKESSDDDSSSDESSDDEPSSKKQVVAAKNGKVAAPAKNGSKSVMNKEDDSSDGSDSDDTESDEPTVEKKVSGVAPPKKVNDSDSSSDSDSEDEKKPTATKKVAAAVTSDSSSGSDSEDEKVTSKSAAPAKVQPSKKTVKGDSSDSDDDDNADDSDEEPQNKKQAQISKTSGNAVESSEEDEDSEEESEEEPSKTPKKNNNDVEMVDAVSPKTKQTDSKSEKKAPQTPATPQGQTTGKRKTLFMGNLSFNAAADVENFFKDSGEVVDVRFASDPDGRFKGFGHVEFATAEAAQKAITLNGGDLIGRPVKLDFARERGQYTPNNGKENSFQKGGRGQSHTAYVRGFDKSVGEDEIRSALQEHFGSCGEITRLSIPKDFESGSVKGFAYVDFNSSDCLNSAIGLDGSELGGEYLSVEEARPRGDGAGSGRGGGRFGGRRGGGRGGSGGGRGRGTSSFGPSGKKTKFNDDE